MVRPSTFFLLLLAILIFIKSQLSTEMLLPCCLALFGVRKVPRHPDVNQDIYVYCIFMYIFLIL